MQIGQADTLTGQTDGQTDRQTERHLFELSQLAVAGAPEEIVPGPLGI
jgi:hypothetical protein